MKSRVCVEVLLLFWNHPKQQASGYLRTAPSCVFFSERSYLSLPPRIFRTREIHSADIGIVPKSNCFCAQSSPLILHCITLSSLHNKYFFCHAYMRHRCRCTIDRVRLRGRYNHDHFRRCFRHHAQLQSGTFVVRLGVARPPLAHIAQSVAEPSTLPSASLIGMLYYSALSRFACPRT